MCHNNCGRREPRTGLYFVCGRGRYFILWDIVDPRTESNPNPNLNPEPNPKPNPKPNPNPNPEPNPKPNPNPNPDPDPNCGFTISHKMKYLRREIMRTLARIFSGPMWRKCHVQYKLNNKVCYVLKMHITS